MPHLQLLGAAGLHAEDRHADGRRLSQNCGQFFPSDCRRSLQGPAKNGITSPYFMNNTRTVATKELKTLAAEVVRLSHLLTRERENLPAAYLNDAGLREAYRTYFLPPNLEKVQVPLRAIALHPGRVLEKEKLRPC
jgi:hypothetical protein